MRNVRPLAVLFLISVATDAVCDVTVVEYHHAGFDHYFITPVADEIAKLDARVHPFEEWSRTGFSFTAYANAGAPSGSVPICRFFNTSFAPKSSHFYAAHGVGCEDTLAHFPDWGLEDDRLFNAMLPDATGACPGATIPVYRLYNNGMGAAPNHRFVTSLGERQAMINLGYVPEGNGIGVGMCVPSAGASTAGAEGMWRGATSDQTFSCSYWRTARTMWVTPPSAEQSSEASCAARAPPPAVSSPRATRRTIRSEARSSGP